MGFGAARRAGGGGGPQPRPGEDVNAMKRRLAEQEREAAAMRRRLAELEV